MNDMEYDAFAGLKKGAKLLLAFSGGVDSTVAAYLCRKAGYDVLAVNMKLLPESEDRTPWLEEITGKLGIELEILDLQEPFQRCVMRRTWDEFAAGRTPNPCAICNPVFKFGVLRDFALSHGCDAMATGHYVRRIGMELRRGLAPGKDQSYFLFGLSREQIAYSVFPLGALTKPEVREIAKNLGVPNADAPDSQDACFTPKEGSLAEKLRTLFHAEMPCGTFIHTETGKVLGNHTGIHQFTIGQRKGTGVAMGHPAYVQKIDPVENKVFISDRNESLLASGLTADRVNWLLPQAPREPFRAEVQIRFRGKPEAAEVIPEPDGKITVRFDSPLRAITPGQAAVIYQGDRLLGGAWIQDAILPVPL